MDDLDQFPSLLAFGQQVDALAARDAERSTRPGRRAFSRRRVWPGALNDLAPVARLAVVFAVVLAIAAGTYAVPATHAAIGDVYGAFSDWVAGDDGAAPGRALAPGEDLPAWVATQDGEKRVLAQAGGEKLVALRQGDKLTLALADFGTTGTVPDLLRSLARQPIMLVGPGRFIPDGSHSRRPLFGLTSSSVKQIRFNYADGGPSVSVDDLSGAFGILIETNRRPRSLTAYDENGNLVSRLALSTASHDPAPGTNLAGDFRYCPDAARGCPRWPR